MKGTSVSNYVLITPAKNEERFIEKTIESVVSQTLRPFRWIIVDDGSTDRTPEVVARYLARYGFIRLLRLQASGERSFSRKAAAFNAGLQFLEGAHYSFLGNLDADVSLASSYYENMMAEFSKNARLGIAGGILYTKLGPKFMTSDNTPDSVGGAVQLFRRECFEEIGGYLPLPYGGIDAAAEITARMKGWIVRKFPENKVYEYRHTGSALNGLYAARFKEGLKFHSLGYSTIFYLLRCISRLKDPPFLVGSALSIFGFLYAKVKTHSICLAPDAVSYLRSEQMRKMRRMLLLQFRTPDRPESVREFEVYGPNHE